MSPQPAFRIAFRQEGAWWRAYLAKTDGMSGALEIGRIRLAFVMANAETKGTFIKLMQDSLADALRSIGVDPGAQQWNPPEPAPEAERSGNA